MNEFVRKEWTLFCTGRGTHEKRLIGPIVDNRTYPLPSMNEWRSDLFIRNSEPIVTQDGIVLPARNTSVEGHRSSRGDYYWFLNCPTCLKGRPTGPVATRGQIRWAENELVRRLDALTDLPPELRETACDISFWR